MPLSSDLALCVRRIEYSETSQILTLFGRQFGLMRLIAKGAHRRTKAGSSKFDGGIDLLDLGNAVFSHSTTRELPPLTEWKLVEGHQLLHRNLRAMYLGMLSAELIYSLIEEHDPHPDIFDAFLQCLGLLQTPAMEESFLMFFLGLLRDAGYLPEFTACTECGVAIGTSDRAFFSPTRGGVVCRNCETVTPDRIELDIRLLRLVQSLLSGPARLPRLTRHQTDPINRILIEHIEYAIHHRLRLRQYVLPGRARTSRTV